MSDFQGSLLRLSRNVWGFDETTIFHLSNRFIYVHYLKTRSLFPLCWSSLSFEWCGINIFTVCAFFLSSFILSQHKFTTTKKNRTQSPTTEFPIDNFDCHPISIPNMEIHTQFQHRRRKRIREENIRALWWYSNRQSIFIRKDCQSTFFLISIRNP